MSTPRIVKTKILKLATFFFENTDDEHVYSAAEICAALEEQGVSAERKAIYSDIEALQSLGMDIVHCRSPKSGYFLASRRFETAEIRLIIDAIQAAAFISPRKSDALISKMAACTSKPQSEMLLRQVYVDRRNKGSNEEIYYNIDVLFHAIDAGLQVKFQYVHRSVSEDLKIQSTERSFTVNPYALVWSNDHYYLVCNNPKYDNLMHTRLDRMKRVRILDTKSRDFSEVSPYEGSFNSADYAGKLFNMYSGEEKTVTLLCRNEVLEDILDRFGNDVPVVSRSEEKFSVQVPVVAGDGFISWVMQFGGDVEVAEPEDVRRCIVAKAKEIAEIYD